MKNGQFKFRYVWVLCVVLGVVYGGNANGAQTDKEVDRLARAYRSARTEFDRRAVCLDAIDAGVVARGRPVAVVDAIFGTKYARELPPGSELESGVVDFRPQLKSPRDNVQVAFVGWYLAFQFDSNGRLQDYYLSNLHK